MDRPTPCPPPAADAEQLRRWLRDRLDLLDPADRILLELVGTGERSLRQTARLLGRDPGSTARRYRQLWKRLTDPAVALLIDADLGLTAIERRIALGHLLCGRRIGQLARREGVSPNRVRDALAAARGAVRAHRQLGGSTRPRPEPPTGLAGANPPGTRRHVAGP